MIRVMIFLQVVYARGRKINMRKGTIKRLSSEGEKCYIATCMANECQVPHFEFIHRGLKERASDWTFWRHKSLKT
jgi:hypothetical protein